MAFRIQRAESIHHAIKRMVHHEIDAARAALIRGRRPAGRRRSAKDLAVEVHDVRTAMKKARALARLVEPSVGGAARAAERTLRHVQRKLSAVRDAEVVLATFDGLRQAAGAPDSRQLATARARLQALRTRRARWLAGPQRRMLLAKLARARRHVDAWAPDDERWRSLGRGAVKAYRRGRRRMRAAYVRDTPEAFHAWRRSAKTHRYQLQVLESLWPSGLGGRRDGLERIGDLLGEEHDLGLLADTLREERACDDSDEACRALLAALEKRQLELRALARPLGERLFAETPSVWGRRLHAYLRTFRHQQPGIGGQAVPPRTTRQAPVPP